jgi:hypothetical protein
MTKGLVPGQSVETRLLAALQAAVALLSLYAKELNDKDGGQRKTYTTAMEWLNDAASR